MLSVSPIVYFSPTSFKHDTFHLHHFFHRFFVYISTCNPTGIPTHPHPSRHSSEHTNYSIYSKCNCSKQQMLSIRNAEMDNENRKINEIGRSPSFSYSICYLPLVHYWDLLEVTQRNLILLSFTFYTFRPSFCATVYVSRRSKYNSLPCFNHFSFLISFNIFFFQQTNLFLIIRRFYVYNCKTSCNFSLFRPGSRYSFLSTFL